MPRPRSSIQIRLPSTVINLPAVLDDDGVCARTMREAAPAAANATNARREKERAETLDDEGESSEESMSWVGMSMKILDESMRKASHIVKGPRRVLPEIFFRDQDREDEDPPYRDSGIQGLESVIYRIETVLHPPRTSGTRGILPHLLGLSDTHLP